MKNEETEELRLTRKRLCCGRKEGERKFGSTHASFYVWLLGALGVPPLEFTVLAPAPAHAPYSPDDYADSKEGIRSNYIRHSLVVTAVT
jgi:hypothetical protein